MYRQTTLSFTNTPTLSGTNTTDLDCDNTQSPTANPASANRFNSSISQEVITNYQISTVDQLPNAIIQTMMNIATKYAAISCDIYNSNRKIDQLLQNLESGTTPKHLLYKFKKMYNHPAESNLKTIIIRHSIEFDIKRLRTKVTELQSTFATRHQDLRKILDPTLKACELLLNTEFITSYFDTIVKDKKITFMVKQQRDEFKKQQKHEKFLHKKEKENQASIITLREHNKLKNDIKLLTTQIKQLKLNQTGSNHNKQRKSKNVKRILNKPNPKSKKSTGPRKDLNGKRKSTVKNNQ